MAYDITDFESQVILRSREVPVLVDFWAPWCGPCLQFAPALESLAAEANGLWDLAKVNIDEHMELATTFRVRSVPTVILFRNGLPVGQFSGARSNTQVKEFLAPHLPSPQNSALVKAREALAVGKMDAVRETLESAPDKDDEGWCLLAHAWLASDPNRVAECIARVPVGSKWSAAAEGLGLLALAIQSVGTIPESASRDVYAAGLDATRKLDWETALQRWLSVMRDDPKFANGSATEAIKAVFRVLGPRHPVVEAHHRSFSSLLYS
jgi:putative thioredoxin